MAAMADAPSVLFARQSGGNAKQQDSHTDQGSSLSALVSTLVPVLLISSVIFLVFLFLAKKLHRVYQPRTFIASLRNWQRSPKQSPGFLGWRKEYSMLRDDFVLGHASIDNYLWLRFFRMLAIMCLVGCFLTWPVLFPVNATGSGPGSGLDILTFSHVQPGPRYYAQAIMAWVFLGWVMFMIWRESHYFVRLQQHYFLSPYQKARISTRTILYVNVPEEFRNEDAVRREYNGVRKVWLVTVPKQLADDVDDRDTAATKLETGEMKLLTNVTKRQLKAEKKGNSSSPATGPGGRGNAVTVDKKDVPTHRLPVLKFLPLGKKVNTIDWARSELHRLIPQVASDQAALRHDRSEPQGALFIEFESVAAAHNALQQAGAKSKAKSKVKMTPKEIGMTPDEVLWKNVIKSFATVQLFNIVCTAFVWFLCIFWTIPVAVIGAISNIDSLTDTVPFLSFINQIPSSILGVVTGLLPVVLLAVLMLLVPIIMNIMAKLFEPTLGSAQLKVQGWYFPFQVIQVFLITTFSSGAAAVVGDIIDDPTQAPTLLAQNLPRASNFYISYFIIFGLLTASLQFLNIAPLLFFLILGKILDKTPRKQYNRFVSLAGVGWGALYPKFTNLGVIALAYSCIAPLVLGFATVGFFLLYLGFRYNVLFTLGTQVSTRGESYARALQQLTTGIYLSEICLIGLFAIGTSSTNMAIGPLVLMIICLAGTIVWHVFMNRSLQKLRDDLPSEGSAGFISQMEHPAGGADAEKYPGIDQHGAHQGYSHNPQAYNGGATHNGNGATHNGHVDNDGYAGYAAAKPEPNVAPAAKPGMMTRIKAFFKPQTAASNAITSISPLLNTPSRPYTREEEQDAYVHPAIISECPIVWIARDAYGLSGQEVRASRQKIGEGFEMTDDQAWFDEKGKVTWSQEVEKAPIWEDEPAY
ncbi:phosphate metabolism protein 7 [Saxophila tyrrhenica]|uniref:Phosphate metabolism protein 7 n=1 Tax=Saxophila tyrrhenica TaxID=1690608 RepID=A0AAV9P651_9PEZI|nr:phosphate metabolism protein 7 [Saxophila tyrrhenica]